MTIENSGDREKDKLRIIKGGRSTSPDVGGILDAAMPGVTDPNRTIILDTLTSAFKKAPELQRLMEGRVSEITSVAFPPPILGEAGRDVRESLDVPESVKSILDEKGAVTGYGHRMDAAAKVLGNEKSTTAQIAEVVTTTPGYGEFVEERVRDQLSAAYEGDALDEQVAHVTETLRRVPIAIQLEDATDRMLEIREAIEEGETVSHVDMQGVLGLSFAETFAILERPQAPQSDTIHDIDPATTTIEVVDAVPAREQYVFHEKPAIGSTVTRIVPEEVVVLQKRAQRVENIVGSPTDALDHIEYRTRYGDVSKILDTADKASDEIASRSQGTKTDVPLFTAPADAEKTRFPQRQRGDLSGIDGRDTDPSQAVAQPFKKPSPDKPNEH